VQILYIAASLILVLTALAHSVIGEVMIFRKLSEGRIVPSMSAPPLKERNVRILWASWHLTSIFGLVFALAVYKVGIGAPLSAHELVSSIAIACLAGGMLVLIGTKGRHPGWISLSLASALIWYAYKAAV
jgi:hypothetical protein